MINLKKFASVLFLYVWLLSSVLYGGIKINFENLDSITAEVTVGEELDVVYEDASTGVYYRVLNKPTGSKIKVESKGKNQKFYLD